MSENANETALGDQPLSQQQALGDVQVHGDDNTFNVIQAQVVTLTQTKIIQISVDEIKTRQLNITSPYKGLKPFEPEDTDKFFGRDQFLAGLVNELEQTNLVLLLGASGSGKSSVVRAGLIPWLQKKWGSQFDSLMLTPDHNPFDSLYGSLLGRRHKQSEVRFVTDGSIDTLNQVVTQLKPPKSFWLIFIDQFEELFTVSEPDKRDRFITSLVKLSQERSTDPLLKIVATMRADFLDQLDPAPANQLASLTQKHRPLITQMQPDELRLAIEQPAAQHGVVFEQGLVEEITKDVQGQAGYLPLLQYTLDLLWDIEVQNGGIQDRLLSCSCYRRLGGVRGALQKRVDQIYQDLSQPEQLAAQRIFLKLVQIGTDEGAGTDYWKPFRRRADLSEFTSQEETTVLRTLIDAHLLVSGEQDATVEDPQAIAQRSTVEIAHEVLLTSWGTLNNWIRQHREAINLRNRLNDDVKQWKTTQSDDELWSGRKLDNVVKLRDDRDFIEILGGFHADANQFIDASVGLAERKKQEQKQRELKARITAGDDRRAALMELLESCTVKLTIPGQTGSSTGFFVAPGKIVTCAPEIVGAEEQPIQVSWQDQGNYHKVTSDRVFQSANIAILKLTAPHADHPCVYLDQAFRMDDPVCVYGYSEVSAKGSYSIGKCEKQTGKNRDVVEFETKQDALKLQSAPLLNWKTLKVCGIVQSTQDHVRSVADQDDVTVGKAISAATILAAVGDLKQEQRAFHKKDRRWRDLFPPRCKPRTVALASLGMTVLVVLVRSFQVFQPLELGFYDTLMRTRLNPPEPSDRFLIVTITKQDAEAQEKRGEVTVNSLSNITLSQLLQKIQTLKPTAIGLDIYRDQPLNIKQDQALQKLFLNPTLFAVCKAGYGSDPQGVSSPPGVTLDRVGFSDFLPDDDKVLRRQLLAFSQNTSDTTSRCSPTQSFSLLIAEHYLQQSMHEIQVTVDTSNRCQINFSNGLEANTGGYQGYVGDSARELFEGCQVLLNYRHQQDNQEYKVITLEEFLKPDFPAQGYSNRIVLIGVDRSDGISDNFTTPYDQDVDQVTTGVVVQAHMIDQIIDAALKKNSLIWVLPGKVDVFLILISALLGGGLGWLAQSPRQLGIIVALSGGSVLIISFVLFQFGGWVPLMPHFLALSAASSSVFWCNLRLRSVVAAKPVKKSLTRA
jgi:CHASE2 domain-containing sensor protein/energy-coupling factor transporter ATP-binding protein EcfA2